MDHKATDKESMHKVKEYVLSALTVLSSISLSGKSSEPKSSTGGALVPQAVKRISIADRFVSLTDGIPARNESGV